MKPTRKTSKANIDIPSAGIRFKKLLVAMGKRAVLSNHLLYGVNSTVGVLFTVLYTIFNLVDFEVSFGTLHVHTVDVDTYK